MENISCHLPIFHESLGGCSGQEVYVATLNLCSKIHIETKKFSCVAVS